LYGDNRKREGKGGEENEGKTDGSGGSGKRGGPEEK